MPEKTLCEMTNEEKDALVQGVELGLDYNLKVTDADIVLYNTIIKQRVQPGAAGRKVRKMSDCRKCLNYKAFSETCLLKVASQEEIKSNPVSTCLNFEKSSGQFTFEITDDEGKHVLQSDRDCTWKCKSCKKEKPVGQEELIKLKDKILPTCPDCGNDMKLHYWLDCQK